ncbi:hypothetical protein PVAP13_9KG044214 [Panicum virgatum]|uniref:Uncharacterized protein n=1 Tax=Panicum virgatum TaxID=38727 RepID=A0A8T0ND26_PANVG|nr:hypothetical protein PVAP13_9KG044214 [Panicum virgatum]
MRFASAGRRFSFGDGSAATGDAHAEQGSVEMEADRGWDRVDGRVHRAEMGSAGGVSDGDCFSPVILSPSSIHRTIPIVAHRARRDGGGARRVSPAAGDRGRGEAPASGRRPAARAQPGRRTAHLRAARLGAWQAAAVRRCRAAAVEVQACRRVAAGRGRSAAAVLVACT